MITSEARLRESTQSFGLLETITWARLKCLKYRFESYGHIRDLSKKGVAIQPPSGISQPSLPGILDLQPAALCSSEWPA